MQRDDKKNAGRRKILVATVGLSAMSFAAGAGCPITGNLPSPPSDDLGVSDSDDVGNGDEGTSGD